MINQHIINSQSIEDLQDDLRELLTDIRFQRQLTQAEFADKLAICRQHWNEIETGKKQVTLSLLSYAARVFRFGVTFKCSVSIERDEFSQVSGG